MRKKVYESYKGVDTDSLPPDEAAKLFAEITVDCAVEDDAGMVAIYEQDDLQELRDHQFDLCSRVANEAMDFSGMTKEGREDLEGN